MVSRIGYVGFMSEQYSPVATFSITKNDCLRKTAQIQDQDDLVCCRPVWMYLDPISKKPLMQVGISECEFRRPDTQSEGSVAPAAPLDT